MIFSPRAGFRLAQALQSGESRPLGEIFQFLSGLYFRGKLAYARAFARPPPGLSGGLVITSNRGVVPEDTATTLEDLRGYAAVPISPEEARYSLPLQKSVRRLAAKSVEVVLLGSISAPKYVGPLLAVLGGQLLFPTEFVGRGDMSRGGLMLRCARSGDELSYQRVAGATRRGVRPPRLSHVVS